MMAASMAGGPGGGPGGGAGGAPGGPVVMAAGPPAEGGAGGQPGQEGGGRRMMILGGAGGPAGGGGATMSSLSEEDRTKMRAAMQKALNGRSMQDLTPEERQKIFEEVRKAVPALANVQRGGQGGEGRRAGREGRGGDGQGGGSGMRVAGGPGAGAMMPSAGIPGGFSEKDVESAKLPPPAEEGNQLDVLLRPGLLADVEIILEKIPNALNIPNQAVFEKDGKHIVYVRKGKAWEERVITPLKRSETIMVIASGVQPGEEVAMSDPMAKPGDKKSKDKPATASPMGGMPGGGRS
jgi:hypothetical protein